MCWMATLVMCRRAQPPRTQGLEMPAAKEIKIPQHTGAAAEVGQAQQGQTAQVLLAEMEGTRKSPR